MLTLHEHATLILAERRALEQSLAPLTTLQAVVQWAFGLTPPSDVADVVVQDEFNHDVVIRWIEPRWLVFDTT